MEVEVEGGTIIIIIITITITITITMIMIMIMIMIIVIAITTTIIITTTCARHVRPRMHLKEGFVLLKCTMITITYHYYYDILLLQSHTILLLLASNTTCARHVRPCLHLKERQQLFHVHVTYELLQRVSAVVGRELCECVCARKDGVCVGQQKHVPDPIQIMHEPEICLSGLQAPHCRLHCPCPQQEHVCC